MRRIDLSELAIAFVCLFSPVSSTAQVTGTISGYPRQARIVLVALKRYGMLVSDNGSSWYITGAPDPRWSNDQLHTLGRVKGSDFEVVQGR